MAKYQNLNHQQNGAVSQGGGRNTVYFFVVCIFVFSVIIAAVHLNVESSKLERTEDAAAVLITPVLQQSGHSSPPVQPPSPSQPPSYTEEEEECNLFEGRWVFYNDSIALYDAKECAYMSEQLACEKYGRKELSYQKWRWQPHHCNLPRFNATSILEKLRDKRLVYVGDSLNRGQWVSMVCLVEKAIRPGLKTMTVNGSLSSFKAIEYNASIEYYWAPMLVESNGDHPVNHSAEHRIVRVQAIEKHARHWTDADVLIFDSYLWWLSEKMKVVWGSFGSSDAIFKDVDMPLPYEMALRTWAEWLQVHIDRTKTQMFFVSLSPTHYRAEDWGGAKGKNCYDEIGPIRDENYWGSNSVVALMRIAERAISDLRTRGLKIELLNITQLSEYRKDGHPTIYRKQWEPLKKELLANPVSYADCAHWCLPGVPDTWNEILHTYIV
ncbi:hypothetical protein QQ045_022993 [Rhodiola kirilowii]